jgi:hypothetical protein
LSEGESLRLSVREVVETMERMGQRVRVMEHEARQNGLFPDTVLDRLYYTAMTLEATAREAAKHLPT